MNQEAMILCIFKRSSIYFLFVNALLFLSRLRYGLVVSLWVLVSACFTYNVQVANEAEDQYLKHDQAVNHHQCPRNEGPKVLTLNVAHGRKKAAWLF